MIDLVQLLRKHPLATALGALLIALSILLAACFVRGLGLQLENSNLLREKERVEFQLKLVQAQVTAWQKEAEARDIAAKAAMAQAAKYRALADARAQSLYDLQLPLDECDALRTLVDHATAGRLPVRSGEGSHPGSLPGDPPPSSSPLPTP